MFGKATLNRLILKPSILLLTFFVLTSMMVLTGSLFSDYNDSVSFAHGNVVEGEFVVVEYDITLEDKVYMRAVLADNEDLMLLDAPGKMINDDESIIIRRNYCEDDGFLISITFFVFDKEFTLDTAYGWLVGEGREEVILESSERTITIVYSGERIKMTGKVIPDYHYYDLVCVDVFEVETINYSSIFTDVSPEMQFYPYIEAIYAAGITTGYGDGTFRPNDPVNRGQMAAFIARALELPDAGDPNNPSFTDVPSGMQFFDYIEAIYAEGITTGYGDGTFRPNDPVNRGQMAAFIARALELPEAGDPNSPSFTDVPPGMQFFDYIEAIYADGITTGYGDNTYRPYDTVNRGQMAAFLSRALDLTD